MSYPRNAASPPTVTLGAIVQISDGAVQTSGASVRVKIGTGAWGAGAGTLACDATSGVWTYLPTQAETNDTHFSVAAYKASCVPVGVTVITSASDSAGYAGVDWSKVANPTTTLGLSGTTFATSQVVASVTGNVGGNVSGSVGLIAGVTFPTNFAALGISSSGHVSRVTLCDTITTYTGNTPQTGDSYSRLGAPAGASVSADIAEVLAAASATSGSGAYTRTITVNDGSTALQGAKVRLSQGSESYVGTTNASGQVVFAVDAATWSIAITKPGYTFTPTTLAVSASGSTTYSMTASGPTPSSDPDKTTVRITCYGADTEPEASATVQLRQLTAPSGDEGNAFDGAWTTYTTDAEGIVDVTLWSDATYAIRRGTSGDPKQFTPTGATDSFTSILSR